MTQSLFSVTRNRSLALSLMAAIALAGCGGGGGSSAPAPVAVPVAAPAPAPAPIEIAAASSDLAPGCANCGATTSTTYSGSGVGIWSKKNTGTAPVAMQVDIVGMSAKDVTLVFTNETNADVSMTSVALGLQTAAPLGSQMAAPPATPNPLTSVAAQMQPRRAEQDAIKEFNRIGFKEHLHSPKARVAALAVSSTMAAVQFAVGATRSFNYHGDSSRPATLKKQVQLSDGVLLNVWVEDTEVSESKVSNALITQLSTSFGRTGGIYDMLKETGGPLWGPHNLAELLPPGQPIDIVILNFVPDGQPFGEMGYFHAINSFKKSAAPQSNEAVSLYLDAETLYLGGAKGVQAIQGTLAHEGMHMSNFYRRGILMGSDHQFDTWLEEMSAMMMEDAAGNAIDPSYNPTRDMRYPNYLSYASYNCPLLNFTGFGDVCESYSVSGSFGGFLLRQMGTPLLKNLLVQNVTNSETALQNAIQASRPQSSLGEELRKFSAGAIAALPAASAPTGFNFPARTDGNFSVPVIDAVASKSSRNLLSFVPSTLHAYASFPVVRKAVTGRYKETIQVPAGVTLSVVIN